MPVTEPNVHKHVTIHAYKYSLAAHEDVILAKSISLPKPIKSQKRCDGAQFSIDPLPRLYTISTRDLILRVMITDVPLTRPDDSSKLNGMIRTSNESQPLDTSTNT